MLSDNVLPNATQSEENAALQQLIQVVTNLDPVQVELLTEVATVMMRRVEETINPGSDLVTPRFAANFRNRLLIHHATNESKLTKKAFEYAFKGACEADGKTGFITLSDTFSGADVTIDGVRFSLKTEASKNIEAEQIVISKFTEAQWIQKEVELADLTKRKKTLDELAGEAANRIPAHLNNYDRILVLRAIELPAARLRYEIVEIPRRLLQRVAFLTVADFTPLTKGGGTSAKATVDGKPAFTLRLDGSDGKITIAGLQIAFCTRHASWIIPTVAPAPEESVDVVDVNLFSPAQAPPGD